MDELDKVRYRDFGSRGELNAMVMLRLRRAGREMHPVFIESGVPFAGGFWSRGWYMSLQRQATARRRMSKARAMVRLGNVINLVVASGRLEGDVIGSRLDVRHVEIEFGYTAEKVRALWSASGIDGALAMREIFAGDIGEDARRDVLSGESVLFDGLLASGFSCSCDSAADVCSHSLALLLAFAVVVDRSPEELFRLWGFGVEELAGCSLPVPEEHFPLRGGGKGLSLEGYRRLMKGFDCVGQDSPVVLPWSAARFTRLRRGLGKAQKELAGALGVSSTTVSFWENGRLVISEKYWPKLSELEREIKPEESAADAVASAASGPRSWDGARVKALRLRLGKSLMDFAVALHVSLGTVSNWEHGRSPVSRRSFGRLDELERLIEGKG